MECFVYQQITYRIKKSLPLFIPSRFCREMITTTETRQQREPWLGREKIIFFLKRDIYQVQTRDKIAHPVLFIFTWPWLFLSLAGEVQKFDNMKIKNDTGVTI